MKVEYYTTPCNDICIREVVSILYCEAKETYYLVGYDSIKDRHITFTIPEDDIISISL